MASMLLMHEGIAQTPAPIPYRPTKRGLRRHAQADLVETDQLSEIAWQRFGHGPTGWARVQAICDFVHRHIEFGYHHARRTRTAWEAYNEGQGVCRDFAHLAITLCRCMNIPARYCTGYLGDIGTPKPWGTMDFAGWFEAWLGDRWYTP